MGLLQDLKDFVTQANTAENIKNQAAVDALFNSIDFQANMINAAKQGHVFTVFPLSIETISGMYKDYNQLRDIEDQLVLRLKTAYPEIKFYKDKYKYISIYGQWEELDLKKPQGPVL